MGGKQGRVFLRGMTSDKYSLSEFRKAQLEAPRVRGDDVVVDDADAALLNQGLRHLHLLATVTFDAIEDVGRHAVGMEPAQDVFAVLHLAHDNRNQLLLTVII